MKYFLKLAYKGQNYHGWQRQKVASSVQATIEDNLRKIFHPKITIHGCGRTDTGVNASTYYAHVILEHAVDFDLVYKLNRMLPSDIAILELIPVKEQANAQRDAISRTYEYYVHTTKDPFLVDKSACYDMIELDISLMEAATQLLSKYDNFKYFCLQPELHHTTICKLSSVSLSIVESTQQLCFRFIADRFLRGMIRIIMGRILEVGQGKISLSDLEKSLSLQQANKFMTQAYPQGLYLAGVSYPEDIFIK